jgi:two-component sensor histidine kinase
MRADRAGLSLGGDGDGLPGDVDFGSSCWFGLILIDTMARRLKGTIRIERGRGAGFALQFDCIK